MPMPAVDLTPIARQMITRFEVDTAYGPPIELDDPFAPGPPNPYLEKLKPRVKLFTSTDAPPITIAPYGEPPPTKWPLLRDSLVLSGIVGSAILVWFVARSLR